MSTICQQHVKSPAARITVAVLYTAAPRDSAERRQSTEGRDAMIGLLREIVTGCDKEAAANLEILCSDLGVEEIDVATLAVAAGLPVRFVLSGSRSAAIESVPAELREQASRLLTNESVHLQIAASDGGSGRQARAVATARHATIAAADVLVAVGPTSAQLTRQIRSVCEGGKPLLVVSVPFGAGPVTWFQVRNRKSGDKQFLEELRPAVAQVVRGVESGTSPLFERLPRWTVGGIFPSMMYLIAGSAPTPRWYRTDVSPKQRNGALAWPEDVELWFKDEDKAVLGEIRSAFIDAFTRADSTAIYYSNLFRTGCVCIVLLNALAVACALLVFFDPGHRQAWEVMEIAGLLMALILVIAVKRMRLQRHWLEYRLLAEMLRPAPYAAGLGEYFETRQPDAGDLSSWNRVIGEFRQVIRRAKIPPLVFTGSYLHGIRALLVRYIESQVNWHRCFAREHQRYHARMVRVGSIMFWAGLTASATQALVNVLQVDLGLWQVAQDLLPKIAMSAACVCAAFGFGASVIIHQLGFAHIADRSDGTARGFEQLREEINSYHGTSTVEQLRHWLSQAMTIAMDEQVSWYKQVVKMSLHL